ncbi:hypothetical protein M1L60_40390 [Actinoplanes sp. TRM 88003]|uniref:RAMA domain-containing protein n=1 Tax=Paractinoplanes aksuensis TaxID=2939490 RepID=A0ABT1E146_9ACTN|nr:hypothetical protein [Actinoplanes aksuensis]MCO8276858.1 hypothetical protein [Actinoplanes aksuensis]
MRRIEIDDEVYAHLENNVKGFEQPNDVLRRLLLDPPPSGAGAVNEAPTAGPRSPGRLRSLLDNGKVAAGDIVRHSQVRKGRTFTAVIEDDGWIKTDKGSYREPSPALGDLVETSIDGWAYWIHEPTKKSLRTLRSEIGGV